MKNSKLFSRKTAHIAQAVMNAIIPPGGPFPAGAADYNLLPGAEQFMGAFDKRTRALIPLLLSYIQYSALFHHGRPFTSLKTEEASAFLEKIESSRFYYKRAMMMIVKLMTVVPFFDIDEVARQIGYEHRCKDR